MRKNKTMKVHELINALKEFPQDAEVYTIRSNDWGEFIEELGEPYLGDGVYSEHFEKYECIQDIRRGVIIP